jgi:hypothetical protein
VTADVRLDDAGIVYLNNRAGFWQGPWNVAYTAGRLVPLEKHLLACKEQLRHLWETQRGPAGRPSMGGEDTFTTAAGFSFAVPERVLELLGDEMIPAF